MEKELSLTSKTILFPIKLKKSEKKKKTKGCLLQTDSVAPMLRAILTHQYNSLIVERSSWCLHRAFLHAF